MVMGLGDLRFVLLREIKIDDNDQTVPVYTFSVRDVHDKKKAVKDIRFLQQVPWSLKMHMYG